MSSARQSAGEHRVPFRRVAQGAVTIGGSVTRMTRGR